MSDILFIFLFNVTAFVIVVPYFTSCVVKRILHYAVKNAILDEFAFVQFIPS